MPFADPEYRSDLERMLVYHSWSRAKYLDLFDRLPWKVLVRKRGSTFESIRNVHLHVLAVYAGWLATYFRQKRLKRTVRSLKESQWHKIRSVQQMREFNHELDAAVQAVARRLGPDDFDRKRSIGKWKGKTWTATPREVLWHMVEEDFLHHGEILCMLWQDDIEPPYTGVWWFEFDHDPTRHGDLWYSHPDATRPSLGGYTPKGKARAARTRSRRRAKV